MRADRLVVPAAELCAKTVTDRLAQPFGDGPCLPIVIDMSVIAADPTRLDKWLCHSRRRDKASRAPRSRRAAGRSPADPAGPPRTKPLRSAHDAGRSP